MKSNARFSLFTFLAILLVGVSTTWLADRAIAQPGDPPAGATPSPAEQAARELASDEPVGANQANPNDGLIKVDLADPKEINLLETLLAGGWLMLPILALMLLVITFSVERGLALPAK